MALLALARRAVAAAAAGGTSVTSGPASSCIRACGGPARALQPLSDLLGSLGARTSSATCGRQPPQNAGLSTAARAQPSSSTATPLRAASTPSAAPAAGLAQHQLQSQGHQQVAAALGLALPCHPVHVAELHALVQARTPDSWRRASELLKEQVPARVRHLQAKLRRLVGKAQDELTYQMEHPSARSARRRAQPPPTAPTAQLPAADEVGVFHADAAHEATPEEHLQALAAAVEACCARMEREVRQFEEEGARAVRLPAAATGDSQGAALLECVEVARAAYWLRAEVEAEWCRACDDFRALTTRPGWWDQAGVAVQAVDEVMDCLARSTFALRVLLSEGLCCWQRVRRAQGLPGLGFSTEDLETGNRAAGKWSMAGPTGPPGHEQLEAQREPASLIMSQAPMVQILTLTVEDTRAFCIEKNSTAPDTEVHGDPGLKVPLCIESYVQHIFTELLKNAMSACIRRYGAWDVDEAEPIQVHVDVLPGAAGAANPSGGGSGGAGPLMRLRVVDTGGGMAPEVLDRLSHWFSTSHKPRRAGWGYSRDHGCRMQGLGVGVPVSRAYARFMGGSLILCSDEREGKTEAVVLVPCEGFAF